LRKLECRFKYVSQTPIWPPNLTHLIVRNSFREFDLGILPQTLKYLTIDVLYPSTCKHWPDSLKHLCILGDIRTSIVPRNQIETIFAGDWHKVLNTHQFPYLKRLDLQCTMFSWEDLGDYDFRLRRTLVDFQLPNIWPLKLFYLCHHNKLTVSITPESRQPYGTFGAMWDFEGNGI